MTCASVKKMSFSLLFVMFSLTTMFPLDADAAIAFVQKVSNTTSSARSLSLNMPANITTGNLLVVSVSGWPNLPAATAVTDNLGNNYSIAGDVLVSQGAYSAVYYARNVKGGTDTVTFTTVNSGGQISMVVAEFSGADTVSPLDKTSGATGSGNTPSSGAMTPATAGSLVIGSGTHNGSTVTTAGSGFTMIDTPTEDSDTHQPLAMEYRLLSGTETAAATFTLATAFPWTQNGVIFRPPGTTQDDTTPPTVTAFTIPAISTSLTVPVSSFTATDNIGVNGYLLTESSSVPSATASGWSATAPGSYSFVTAGSKTLYAWARDAAGNVSDSNNASVTISIVVTDSYSIWPGTTIPVSVDSGPDSAVELGVKFQSDSSGSITGIRFYKAATNSGTHVANLWSSSGTRLATATFSGETASGWQQVKFSTPVAITANTVYVASYHTNVGHYSDDQNFFTGRSVDNPPLHAVADSNGVYAYGSASVFPSQSWNNTNYWVDVVFSPTIPQNDTTPPTVTAFTISTTSTSLTVPVNSLTATDNVGVNGYLLTESATVPSATATGWSATAPGSYTFATAGSKTLYAWARDAAGNVSASKTASVTISVVVSGTIWPASTIPENIDSGPDKSVELGVKFKSDSSGSITGIRFYKAATNTGTHVANLWSSSGTKLATATFSSETASGWQQVNFSTPVAITADTVYVASYHTNVGHYSEDKKFFKVSVDNPPLYAIADGVSGGNGVYAYGSASVFPNQSWNSTNYWVDVVFSAGSVPNDTTAPTVTAFTIPATSTSLTVLVSSFTATDNVGVNGYLLTESSTTPSATASGWSATAPGSYTFATAGSKTLYAWARDAAGNVSASRNAAVVVTATAQSGGPEPAGWYAGDMHVHRSCGGGPEAVSSIFEKMDTNKLSVISLLADMGNGEVQNQYTDLPLVTGRDSSISTSGKILHWDAEWHWDPVYTQYPHQALGGHIVALGLTEAHQMLEEYTYPILDWARQQNAIAGFAHMQYLGSGIPQSLNCCIPLEYPVEVALGAADFISEDVADINHIVSGMSPEAVMQAYYRLLNCGFRPGLAAGTDYPCVPAGTDIGALLTYVQVAGGEMNYRNWIEGIANGKTVISRNGHKEFLDFKVNNSATPGDEIKLTGGGTVQVTITWSAIENFSGTIELVQNGVVVASKQATATSGAPVTLSASVNFTKSGWLAARRMGSNGHQLHTAAVFVIVNNAPIRANVEDAQFYVNWMDNLLERTSPGGEWNLYFPTQLGEAQDRYRSAREIFRQIAVEAGETP